MVRRDDSPACRNPRGGGSASSILSCSPSPSPGISPPRVRPRFHSGSGCPTGWWSPSWGTSRSRCSQRSSLFATGLRTPPCRQTEKGGDVVLGSRLHRGYWVVSRLGGGDRVPEPSSRKTGVGRFLPSWPQPGWLRAAADTLRDPVQRHHPARLSGRSLSRGLLMGDEHRVHDGCHRRVSAVCPAASPGGSAARLCDTRRLDHPPLSLPDTDTAGEHHACCGDFELPTRPADGHGARHRRVVGRRRPVLGRGGVADPGRHHLRDRWRHEGGGLDRLRARRNAGRRAGRSVGSGGPDAQSSRGAHPCDCRHAARHGRGAFVGGMPKLVQHDSADRVLGSRVSACSPENLCRPEPRDA